MRNLAAPLKLYVEHDAGGALAEMEIEMGAIRPLAIVTGASSGIGFELAKLCARAGFDLVIAADDAAIEEAAAILREYGGAVTALQCDLATFAGVDRLYETARTRSQPVEALLANAGHGLGHAFLEQDFGQALHVLNTNVTGTIYLAYKVGREMRARGKGKILFTGSIAGFMPGSYQAVYNGTKAFIDSFSYALRDELKDSGVTVTCLMPGVTDTEFFERADMEDTEVGRGEKDDPADVAKSGFDAMMRGEAGVVHGIKNKMQVAMSGVMSQKALAKKHRKMAKPDAE